MALDPIDIPPDLVSHVTAGCGERGIEWLAELPAQLEYLEHLWNITVGQPFPGIEYNFVAPAVLGDGEHVVIKVHPPWNPIEIFDEAAYLHIRGGDGCVRLLEVSTASRSIMIERLFPDGR